MPLRGKQFYIAKKTFKLTQPKVGGSHMTLSTLVTWYLTYLKLWSLFWVDYKPIFEKFWEQIGTPKIVFLPVGQPNLAIISFLQKRPSHLLAKMVLVHFPNKFPGKPIIDIFNKGCSTSKIGTLADRDLFIWKILELLFNAGEWVKELFWCCISFFKDILNFIIFNILSV